MKLIKRYTNRKLYDTERSCYVTLDEIAEMVREGEEVSILDNRSGEDLTTVTLAQIVYEAEKKDKRLLPLQSLRLIIQSPADFLARIGKPVQEFRQETQQRVELIKKRAEEQQTEVATNVRDFIDNMQQSIDNIRGAVDERMKTSVDALTHVPNLADDIESLRGQLSRIEAEVSALRQTLAEADAAADEQREQREERAG